MQEITDELTFNALLNQSKPVLLDFYADWCPPCKELLPNLGKIAEKYETEFIVGKINVDRNPELAQQFKVRSIPALFVLRDQEVQERLLGYQSEQRLDEVIQKHLETVH